ncbi:diguanylate cyclase [Gemmatimonadota bacterium]
MANNAPDYSKTFTGRLIRTLSYLHSGMGSQDALAGYLSGLRDLFGATAVLWFRYDRLEEALILEHHTSPLEELEEGLVLRDWASFFQALLVDEGAQVIEGEALSEQLPAQLGKRMDVHSAFGVRVGGSGRPHGVLVMLLPFAAALVLKDLPNFAFLALALDRALSSYALREELQNQVDRFLLLHDLSQTLQGEAPIEERLTSLVDNLKHALGAHFGYVMLYDEEEGYLTFGAASGIELEALDGFRIEPGTGVTGRVFTSGKPVLVTDVSLDPDYIAVSEDVVSELAVPILVQGKAIGVLNFESDRPDAFSKDDLRLASIIAAQIGTALQHALAYEEARAHLKELELLNQVTQAIGTIEDMQDLLDTIANKIHEVFETNVVGILLREPGGMRLEVKAAAGDRHEHVGDLDLHLGKGITGAAAKEGKTVYVPDVTRDARYVPADPRIRSELAVPLTSEDEVIGILNLESMKVDAFPEEDRRVIEIVATQTAQILGKAMLYDRLATMAITDGLTGLFNHRHFFMRLEAEFKRSVRYSYPLSLIMVDIDFFKEFNDRHGHMQGDHALRQVAELIMHAVRETDVVARYGGEEFTAILPLCHESTALEVAERLRQTVEQAGLGAEDDGGAPLTVSVGICTAPQHASTYEELVRRADDAMYASKRLGKNLCTVWQEGLEHRE